MGNGRLLNEIGYGGATVFNPSPAIQQFGNILAQQKAEKQAKDQALINQMSTLKPEGVREADKDDYINKYNDWKQTAIAANNLPRNSRQRLDAIANAQSKYNDLGQFISSSKEEKGQENSLGNMMLSNGHMFSDDAHGKVVKSMGSAMSNPDFISHDKYGALERYIDPVKQDDGFDKANKILLKQQDWSNPIQNQGKDKLGNKTGVVVHSEREVDPADILSTHAHMYDLSPDTRKYIDTKYSGINGSTPQETKMLRLKQNAIDRGDLSLGANSELVSGLNEKTKPEFKANTPPDKFYEHHMFIVDHPSGNGTQLLPTQAFGAAMMNGDTNTANQFLNYAPANQFRKGEKPEFSTVNGYHVIKVPDQVTLDPKVAKANAEAKADYEASPEKKGKTLGMFGGTPIPYEQSQDYKENPPADPYKVVKQGGVHNLDPKNPIDYNAQLSEIAKDLKIPTDQINKQVGGKASRGINSAIQKKLDSQPKVAPSSPGMIKVALNGRVGQIPLDKYESFKKENPQAQRVD